MDGQSFIDRAYYTPPHVLLTGATSGIGLELARHYAAQPVVLHLVCRTTVSARQTEHLLLQLNPAAQLHYYVCDMEQQSQVLQLCQQLKARTDYISTCILNAGCIVQRYELTADGVERQLAVNHLANYILCNQLQVLLAGAQVVFISSRVYAHADAALKMITGQQSYYQPTLAYAQTKLMALVFAQQWAEKVLSQHTQVLCVHPGLVASGIGNKHVSAWQSFLWNVMKLFARSPQQAAADVVELLSRDRTTLTHRAIYYRGVAQPLKPVANNPAVVQRVMELSAKLFRKTI